MDRKAVPPMPAALAALLACHQRSHLGRAMTLQELPARGDSIRTTST